MKIFFFLIASLCYADLPLPGPSSITKSESPIEAILSEELIRTLRDPFQLPELLLLGNKKETPKSDLEVYPLKDFKLNGVISGPKKLRAMVTTPNNKVYFLKLGDRIGIREGVVVEIKPKGIKVVEYFTDEHGARAPDPYEITMGGEVVSLSKKREY